jgi:WD40 repeat protein
MTDVFISYSRKDKDFVLRLHNALQERGRSAWVDWEGIPPSAEWMQEINSAIEAADTFVFIITPHSVASSVCSKEVAHAVRNNKRLVPVLRHDADAAAVPQSLSDRNWIFARDTDDFDAAMQTLMDAIDTDLDWVRAHTRLLTRAIEWDANRRDYSFALQGTDLQRAEDYLTAHERKEPALLPLQVEYILASRRDANKRRTRALALGAVALVAVAVFALLFWQKRQESNLTLAAQFREKGMSELAGRNPLLAEVLLARALGMNDVKDTRELLLQARAQSSPLLWISPRAADNSLVAISPDGTLFAMAAGAEAEIWSLESRRRLRAVGTAAKISCPSFSLNLCAAFSVDNRLLAIARDKQIELWDVTHDSSEPTKTLADAEGALTLSFSPEGKLLIAGHAGGAVSIWNLESEAAPVRLSGHVNNVTGVMVDRGTRFLVSGSLDNRAKLWDLATHQELMTLASHEDAVLGVAISPNGELIATGAWDNRIWLWDRATGKKLRVLQGHNGGILSLAFSPDGLWLASGSEDRTARLWDVDTGRHVLTFPGHQNDVVSVSFVGTEGHHRLATGDRSGDVRLWDIDGIGQRDELITLRGHEQPVSVLAFSPDGRLLATASWDKVILLWDLQSKTLSRLLRGHDDSVTTAKFSPDGQRLASSSKDGTIRLWDTATWASHPLKFEGASQNKIVREVAFSPDGRLLVAADDDGMIRAWEIADGRLVHVGRAHANKIQGLAFSPDGTLVASASEDTTIKLWRTADWTEARVLAGHTKGVWQPTFSPDGRFLLSGSDDRTARVWEVATGREVTAPIVQERAVWSVDFSPDGKMIAIGCADATVHLWDFAATANAATLDRHTVLRLVDGPVWYVKFNRDPNDLRLGIGGGDKTARIFSIRRFRSMFADAQELERDAERQGGLQVRRGQSDPDIVPIAQDVFVPASAERITLTGRPDLPD